MIEILFIGSYLSSHKGTKDIAEKISILLNDQSFRIILVSKRKNIILRALEIIFAICTFRGKKIHFDVFSGRAFLITEIGSYLAKIRGKEIIFTLRGGGLVNYTENQKTRINKTLNRATIIQTPSLFLQSYFQELGYKINYMPNPINFTYFPFHKKKELTYKLLWVRSFAKIYQPVLAIEILNEVKKDYHNATLTMIGPDDGELENVMELIRQLKLEKSVEIIGPIANEKLHTYYHTHDVYLNTTKYESFGMAVLEAAACGIPIVSTAVGEMNYLWKDQFDACLVSNNFVEKFAFEIKKIFTDTAFRMSLSQRAYQKTAQFSWELQKHKWIDLISE